MLEKESAPSWMIVREEGALSDERFDEYLFASDAVIFHKYHVRYPRLVSATIFQAIGTDCPIFIPQQSEYFQPLKDEVVYYSDTEDLCRKLIAFCEDERRGVHTYKVCEEDSGDIHRRFYRGIEGEGVIIG
jgi:hypothetical protein